MATVDLSRAWSADAFADAVHPQPGAAWTFAAWECWHGLLLVAYRVVPSLRLGTAAAVVLRPLRVVLWFHLTCLGWLLFRADSLERARAMLEALAGRLDLADPRWVTLLLLAAPVVVLDLAHELGPKAGEGGRSTVVLRWAGAAVLVGLVFLLGSRGGQEFIYFQF